jgi:hypothetical protein|tara:strand:- start:1387 stop:1821 length:435 start_codon:yes stop_codon:yes gene_type:complete
MARFPSVEWLNEVRTAFNVNEEYHGAGGGACEATVGIKVGGRNFRVIFEGLECIEASEIKDDDLNDLDFYLELKLDEWREMIENIKANGSAGLDYTLNTLDLSQEDGLAKSRADDQYRQDLFFRYNQTLQFFFDASSRIDTDFG